MVRSVAKDPATPRSSQNTPMPWDRPQEDHQSARHSQMREARDVVKRDSSDGQRLRIERLGLVQAQHTRNDSGNASSGDFPTTDTSRKHDYDLHAMETNVATQMKNAKNSLPAPVVTVRSEFPTLNRSRQQQSLTCLITVEVPELKSRADPDENEVPPVPPLPSDEAFNHLPAKRRQREPEMFYESPEVLREVTEDLRQRVDNWHGHEFHR